MDTHLTNPLGTNDPNVGVAAFVGYLTTLLYLIYIYKFLLSFYFVTFQQN